ncbi:uncharacterized protein [Kogia breviceps]|uniref:uncharacterized protein n=1 Tax=Kogia breviceps TaxID=27615 RepID=UPI0034D33178
MGGGPNMMGIMRTACYSYTQNTLVHTCLYQNCYHLNSLLLFRGVIGHSETSRKSDSKKQPSREGESWRTVTSPGFPAWLAGAGSGTWRAPDGGGGWRRALYPTGLTGPHPSTILRRCLVTHCGAGVGQGGGPGCGKGADEANWEGRGAGGPTLGLSEVVSRPGLQACPRCLQILSEAGYRLPGTLARAGPILDSCSRVRQGGGARGAGPHPELQTAQLCGEGAAAPGDPGPSRFPDTEMNPAGELAGSQTAVLA